MPQNKDSGRQSAARAEADNLPATQQANPQKRRTKEKNQNTRTDHKLEREQASIC